MKVKHFMLHLGRNCLPIGKDLLLRELNVIQILWFVNPILSIIGSTSFYFVQIMLVVGENSIFGLF